MVMWLSGPMESAQMLLRPKSGQSVSNTALRRRKPNLSQRKAIVTSAMETVDVMAATNKRRKKSDDHTCGSGRRLKTSGRVMNMSDAPSRLSFCNPKVVTAGKMMHPMRMATNRLSMATVNDVLGRLVEMG